MRWDWRRSIEPPSYSFAVQESTCALQELLVIAAALIIQENAPKTHLLISRLTREIWISNALWTMHSQVPGMETLPCTQVMPSPPDVVTRSCVMQLFSAQRPVGF